MAAAGKENIQRKDGRQTKKGKRRHQRKSTGW